MILDKRIYKVIIMIVAILESKNECDAIILCSIQKILW